MKRLVIVFLIILSFFVIYGMNATSVSENKIDNKPIVYDSQVSTLPSEEHEITEPTEQIIENVTLIEKEQIKKLDEVLFMGNSLTCGIQLTTEGSEFIAVGGATLQSMRESGRYNEIKNKNFDVVVVAFGTNELGAVTKQKMSDEISILCKEIYKANEDAVIIISSTPPVSAYRDSIGDRINNNNVKEMNKWLNEISFEQGLYYIDNSEFFGDMLLFEQTDDGVHLKGYLYQEWYSFILEKIKEIEKSQAS